MAEIVVPFHVPQRQIDHLRLELDLAIGAVLDSGWYILGKQVNAFEDAFAAYCGARHCISVANGTDALELGLRALGVGPGDEVITAANAGGYTATATFAIGATPVYADIDPSTLLLDPKAVADVVSARTKVVVATHLYGKLADVDGLRAALKASNSDARVLEDCAQSHGATMADGRRAGTLADLATFSFYPTKNIGALGDGGALTTEDDALAVELKSLRQYGWRSEKYRVDRLGGRNSRMDEMQAAILRVKLGHVDAGNTRRREIANRYGSASGGRLVQPHFPAGPETAMHLCVARSPDRARVVAALRQRGVATAIHYPIPDHLQPALIAAPEKWRAGPLPVTERACADIFSLPCYPEMMETEIVIVETAVAGVGGESA